MIPALIILAVTIGFGAVLYVCHKISEQRTPNNTPDDAEAAPAVEEEGCCGMHITCEKDSLATLSTEIIYYDDEELDAYRGFAPDGYSDSQIEEFPRRAAHVAARRHRRMGTVAAPTRHRDAGVCQRRTAAARQRGARTQEHEINLWKSLNTHFFKTLSRHCCLWASPRLWWARMWWHDA